MLKKVFVTIIKFYQLAISPHTRKACRFYPSCSQYCIVAVEKKGLLKGIGLSFWRVLRCNPFSKGGVDVI